MIHYRKAVLEDIPTLIDLRVEFMKEVIGPDGKKEGEELLRANLLDYFTEKLPTDEFIAWLALEEAEIIATSGLSFYNRPPSFMIKDGRCAYIMNMYTKAAYRGQGIAKTLFGSIVEEAKAKGCSYISLHATELGRPVYEQFGFNASKDEMSLCL
jgi:GNAT superfamily N-acetyltransferase